MADDSGIDPRLLELVERRLIDSIETKLRPRLFGFYAAIGSAVIAVLSLVGWSIFTEAKQNAVDHVKVELAGNVRDQIGKLDVEMQVAEKIRKRVAAQLDEMATTVEAATLNAEKVKLASERIESMGGKLRELEGQIALNSEALQAVQKVSGELAKLAADVNALAGAQPSASNRDVQASTNAIIDASKKSAERLLNLAGSKVVFIQYYAVKEPAVRQLASQLKNQGYVVPEIDNEVMSKAGMRDVRFFHPSDAEAAAALAATVNRELGELADVIGGPVTVKPLVGWTASKPKPGTLELWIGGRAPPE